MTDPITLAVVLRAIGYDTQKVILTADDNYKIGKIVRRWNLTNDNYDDQTEETKKFIGSLLGV
jgi:hypothetical protein